jgi:hypothetical protein
MSRSCHGCLVDVSTLRKHYFRLLATVDWTATLEISFAEHRIVTAGSANLLRLFIR